MAVIAIGDGPACAVYDLTLPAVGNFATSGIVAKNCDEVELVDYAIVNESMSQTQSKSGWRAQDTLTSTRKISSGTMQKLLDEGPAKGFEIYTWCVWEVVERCERQCKNDPEYGDCPIYSRKMADGTEQPLCGGKAHTVPGGYLKIEDIIKKARLLDADTWAAQWECKRPNVGQLVYGAQFSRELVISKQSEMDELIERFKADQERGNVWPRGYGQDFGSHWATGGWIQDPVTGFWIKYWEYYYAPPSDRSVKAHCEYIKTHDPLGFDLEDHYGYADPSGLQVITDMTDEGIFFLPANNSRYAGVNFMKAQMEQKLIRWFGTCARTIEEMEKLYIHKANRDGTYDRDKIVDRDDHCCDSDRYFRYSHETLGTADYRMRRLRGV